MLKRILALALTPLTLIGVLAACGNTGTAPTTEPEPTEEPAPKQFSKVLTLGHSLAGDATHMLTLVAAAEGYELTVGTLYYSGCPLYRHVMHLEQDTPAYILYTSSTKDLNPPEGMKDVTMKQALRQLDWDLIVMQGGTFELAEEKTFTDGNIQIIQDYVNEHKLNKDALMAWHMPWAFATEAELQAIYMNTGAETNYYTESYKPYNNDRTVLFDLFCDNVEKHILTDRTFQFLIPSGTAFENALTSYLTEKDMHRDYAHATDLARVITAYTYYCKIANVTELQELKLTTVPKRYFNTTKSAEDWVLTEAEKALILESVNNALKDPLQVTQSQYTERPAQ